MKSDYEIAEVLLKKDIDVFEGAELRFHSSEISEITGISREVLSKLREKIQLTILMEKACSILDGLENFSKYNLYISREVEGRYEGTLSPKTMKLITQLKTDLETEKSLLPIPMAESVNKE